MNARQLSYKYPTNQATSTLLIELHPHLRIIVFIFYNPLWSPSKPQQAAHSLKPHAPNLPFENRDPKKSAQKEKFPLQRMLLLSNHLKHQLPPEWC